MGPRLERLAGGSMKTLTLVILAHVVAITALVFVGLALNTTITTYADSYAGVITVLSTAFGVYSFVVNFLYQRNRDFHFWVNRLRLLFTRTHTYWKPAFDFVLTVDANERRELLNDIWGELEQEHRGHVKKVDENGTTMRVTFDDLMCVVFRLAEDRLHVSLDRRLLVPNHLYDEYRAKLARLAELIQRLAKPNQVMLGLTISFGEGRRNPYYGFFVNRIPPELLQDFHVTFRPQATSSCRIEAGKEEVNIEGNSTVEVFEALNQVLSLKALPGGAAT